MQNRFRELDIFSFLLSEGLIPITDSGTNDQGIPDFTAPYRPWLEGMKMLEGVYTRTEMVVDVDQVGDLRGGTLITLCYAYSYTATK